MSQNTSQRSAPTPAGSQTITQSSDLQQNPEPAPRILRLRGRHANSSRSVQWAEDVVDNEGMGKKSSKVCCIYHRPKAVDESSDESSSSSDSSSDSDSDFDADRRGKRSNHNKHDHSCDNSHDGNSRKKRREGKEDRAPSPNAYERVPKPKPKPEPKDEPQQAKA